ncbi:MAG TPA: NAD(P)/FAD-dependent oxidoreductase [Candidatus Avidesulfovibrio excrementigallinarum]|nr:NAD(P)/FAD-dependent oxidoreductase [Candidatus Avidesulfovibrio excrementigallinarum]
MPLPGLSCAAHPTRACNGPFSGGSRPRTFGKQPGRAPALESTGLSGRPRTCPGLYLTGELLDITGLLGGFNLHRPPASALAAGLAARNRLSGGLPLRPSCAKVRPLQPAMYGIRPNQGFFLFFGRLFSCLMP